MTIRRMTTTALLAACAALAACQGEPQGTQQQDPAQPPLDATPPATQESGLELAVDGLAQGDDGLVRGRVTLAGDAAVRTVALRLAVQGGTLVEWARDDAFLQSAGGQVLQATGAADAAALELAVATTIPATLGDDPVALATFAIAPTADAVSVSLSVDGDRGVIDAQGSRSSPAVRGAAMAGVQR